MADKKPIKSKKFTTKMQKKLLMVFLVVGLFLIVLSVVMIKINLTKGDEYSKAVYDNFNYDSRIIAARRGDITDRNGTILAYSVKVYNLIIDAKVMLSSDEYREPTVESLLKYFPQISEEKLNAHLDENENAKAKSSYKRFLLALKEDEIAEFTELMEKKGSLIKGVWFEAEYQRTYPFGTLASDCLGFASETNGGELGIEKQYEKYLSGTNGRTYGYIDNSEYSSQTIPAVNGNTIVTTLDYTIQNIVENAIADFNEEYGSLSTTIVVMDPRNGEVLAMADYPNYDLNSPRDVISMYPSEELAEMTETEKVDALYSIWSNNAVSKIYEPGSVFKTFTVAQAIEEGLIDLDDTFECDGYGVYNNAEITCHGGEGHGVLTLTGALGMSCNDALMQIGEIIGKPTFSKYLDVFKFGMKTDIDVPSEEAGLLIDLDAMMDVDLATNSFGQNLNVNMMQMMAAFASVINGGYYYEPHMVKEISTASGDAIERIEPILVTQTISEETSNLMKAMLRAVVEYGTGAYAYMDGYSIGGKTGTAEKYPRDKKSYILSFMGFAPAEDPEVLVYVCIDSPKVEDYDSSRIAQVVARDVFEDLLPYLGIQPDYADYCADIYLDPETKEPLVCRNKPVEPGEISGDTGNSLPKDDVEPEEPEEPEEPDDSEEPEDVGGPDE